MVVDEDEDTLELLGEYLGARGMEVLTAYAADEAVALVRSMSVDAVFVEVDEGTAGLALVQESRARASACCRFRLLALQFRLARGSK